MIEAKRYLEEEFEKRRLKNSRFSLRAFAQLLQIPSGRLSEFLAGKRPITFKTAQKISDRLALDPISRQSFLASTNLGLSDEAKRHSVPEYQQLSLDSFRIIADWYHFAILSLMDLKSFRNDPSWIAARIGISTIEARAAIERMIRVELMEKIGARLKKTNVSIATPTDLASSALRKSHMQTLQQAIECLETVAIDDRDVTSISMAIDTSKIPLAKAMIKKFRLNLATVLETGNQTEVYNLNVQLIPVTKLSTKGKL